MHDIKKWQKHHQHTLNLLHVARYEEPTLPLFYDTQPFFTTWFAIDYDTITYLISYLETDQLRSNLS
mgnify:CR=1 FL=1